MPKKNQELKPVDSKLAQLTFNKVIMKPIFNKQGYIKDIKLLASPIYRGGPKVGQLAINNDVFSAEHPGQLNQHYVGLKWSTFNQLQESSFKQSHPNAKFKPQRKSQWIKVLNNNLNANTISKDELDVSFTPSGTINPKCDIDQLTLAGVDARGERINFDAQIDTYKDAITANTDKMYSAINWKSAKPGVSTQYPSYDVFQKSNYRAILMSQVKVRPINVDKNGVPQDFNFLVRPLYRDNTSDHQARKDLIDDHQNKSYSFTGYDGEIITRDKAFQILNYDQFNALLDACHQKPYSKEQLQNLNFEKKPFDLFSDRKVPRYKDYDLDLPKALYFDSFAPKFKSTDEDGTTHTFRYLEPERFASANTIKFFKTNNKYHMTDSDYNNALIEHHDEGPEFNPELADETPASITYGQLQKYLTNGTTDPAPARDKSIQSVNNQPMNKAKSPIQAKADLDQDTNVDTDNSKIEDIKSSKNAKSKTLNQDVDEKLTDHQTLTISLDAFLKLTQVKEHLYTNQVEQVPQSNHKAKTSDNDQRSFN